MTERETGRRFECAEAAYDMLPAGLVDVDLGFVQAGTSSASIAALKTLRCFTPFHCCTIVF